VLAVLLAVATVAVLASDPVGAYGIAQRSYLLLSSIWVLVTAGSGRAVSVRSGAAAFGTPALPTGTAAGRR
jgi:hypothetical protein